MRQRESISEPPINKLEQIRERFQKELIRVKAKGFVSCCLGKFQSNVKESRISFGKSSFLEKLQSIHSFEDDERTLLKSIQCDVQVAIKRYQQRIEQIAQLQIERSSLRSCQQDMIQYFTTPQQEKSIQVFNSLEQTKRSNQEENNHSKENRFLSSDKLQSNKSILVNNKKTDRTFKIITQKQKKDKEKQKQTRKKNDYSLNETNVQNKKQSKDGTYSQKSVSTRQPSVREITINLEQRKSFDRLSKQNLTTRSRQSVINVDRKLNTQKKKIQVF